MHFKRIKGRYYAYESARCGRRFTSRCMGRIPSDLAVECRAIEMDGKLQRAAIREAERLEAEERAEAERLALRAVAERLAEYGRGVALVVEYGRDVDAAVASALEALGYRRHKRGEWRRSRRMLGDGTREGYGVQTLYSLAKLVDRGDELARQQYPETLRNFVEAGGGDLHVKAEQELLGLVRSVHQDTDRHEVGIEAMAELIRIKLAPPDSGPVLKLLAARASLDWLHMMVWEQRLTDEWEQILKGIGLANRTAERFRAECQRNLDRATARYQRSLLAVARAQRLAVPVVIGQMNVAMPGSQQLNQARIEAAPEPC